MPAFGQGPMSAKYCVCCGRTTRHENLIASMGCLLTLLSCGLFLPVWFLFHFVGGAYQCQVCGTRRNI